MLFSILGFTLDPEPPSNPPLLLLPGPFDSTVLAGSARRSSSCDQITQEGITGTVHGVNLITATPGCLLAAR